jgi:hypothetical protein
MSNETKNTGVPEQPESGQSPKVGRNAEEIAAEAVRLAKVELEKAQKFYEDIRQQAAEKYQEVQEKKVGDLVDSTLSAVKKYPGASLIVSVSLGICMGRWWQRMLGR